MLPQESDPSAQMLAGKRTEGPMMRNGEKRTSPRAAQGSTSSATRSFSLDECRNDQAVVSDRGLAQRLSALKNADAIRLNRAATRRRLFSLELDFDTFLDETPDSCLKVPVVKMLTWLPNIGRIKARQMIQMIGTDEEPVSDDTRVAELDARSKYTLSTLVERHLATYRRTYLTAA